MNAGESSSPASSSRDYIFLTIITSLISAGALWFYYSHQAILLYGDAVAHINIARRVFDSRTPGFFQLGTVWLPLPHLIDIPFIVNKWLWRTGLGASIPSMLAFILGTLGVFRLVRGMGSRTAAWIAAAIYALNPNLIYLQSTGMTEPLFLALFIWTIVFFAEFVRQARGTPPEARRSLERCGLVLSAAMLVRYDAWFLSAVLTASVAIYLVGKRRFQTPVRYGIINFVVLTWLTAGCWMAYNHGKYGNSLEFATGQYSARAIQARSRTATMPSYPGENSPRTATLYFLNASRQNLGDGRTQYILLAMAFVSLLACVYFSRRLWPWILLWTPIVFYTAGIAWGSVPIYLPDWWPFSYYNVRYGLQLLPAVAVFAALAYEFLSKFLQARWVATAVALLAVFSYSSIWLHTPICLREAQVNGGQRLQFDEQLAAELSKLPAASTIMMDCSAHPGAIELAGIPFARVLRESNPPYWELALTQPAASADYVVAIDYDDVARAARLFPKGLKPIATVGTSPALRAVIYESVH